MATPNKFYKYMKADTANIVLTNGALRWSAATLFNDPFDLQFDLHMEFDSVRLVRRLCDRAAEIYMGRSEGIPNNKFDEAVKLRRKGKKVTEPQLRDEYAPIFRTTLKQARDNLPKLHEELRPIIAERKILCLSDYSNNIQMWAHYADCHTGAVIEFSYIEEGKYASAWGAARAVRYVPCMPLLADEEAMFLSVTQQKSLSTEDHFLNVVYSKARDWSYEHEWRVLGGFQKGVMTEDIPFRAKEVTAVILGCRMPDADRKELLDIIAKKYAHVTVKIARKAQRRFELEFLHVA